MYKRQVEKLIVGLESFYDVLTSIEKLGQVVDKELEQQDGEMPNYKPGMEIELDDVSYQVSNREKPILKNISLKITPKSRILIQGESGSGKSSLLRLITAVVEPTAGSIYVNKFSIGSLHLNHYRSHLGLSLSEETPFEGTIRENLSFGDDNISDETIFWALEKVGLTQFIKEQPKGLKTVLNPEGKQISYNISKKIVLARAIIKKPKVLILEDPLDQFNVDESNKIIDFLTDSSNPWALIVVSSNERWKTSCSGLVTLEKGEIKNRKAC